MSLSQLSNKHKHKNKRNKKHRKHHQANPLNLAQTSSKAQVDQKVEINMSVLQELLNRSGLGLRQRIDDDTAAAEAQLSPAEMA